MIWEVWALNRLDLSESVDAVAFDEDQARLVAQEIATTCHATVIRCRIRPRKLTREQKQEAAFAMGWDDALAGWKPQPLALPPSWRKPYAAGYKAGNLARKQGA